MESANMLHICIGIHTALLLSYTRLGPRAGQRTVLKVQQSLCAWGAVYALLKAYTPYMN